MIVAIGKYSTEGTVPEPTGSQHTLVAPFDAFQTKDRPITIAVANDRLFELFCKAVGLEQLVKDKRFETNVDRVQNVVELTELISKALKHKTGEEWIEILLKHGVPAGPIHNMDEVFKEPQLAYRNMIAKFEDGYMPHFRFPGNPIKFSAYKDKSEFPRGPKLNEHREQILKWLYHG
jgi:CoA:oxalate CoA-transferase